MTATADLTLVELADGNYVPVPVNLTRTFRGLDADGWPAYDGPAVLPRAYPDHVDAEDYRRSVRCAACGDPADDLRACSGCGRPGCTCVEDAGCCDGASFAA